MFEAMHDFLSGMDDISAHTTAATHFCRFAMAAAGRHFNAVFTAHRDNEFYRTKTRDGGSCRISIDTARQQRGERHYSIIFIRRHVYLPNDTLLIRLTDGLFDLFLWQKHTRYCL